MSAGFFNLKRPTAYQQNDYLGWICRAKRAETQVKRLTQMMKLEMGGLYMKMKYTPSTKL